MLATADTRSGDASNSSSTLPLCDTFYDRDKELQRLENLCKTPPAFIGVILGPRSAGKTKLLQEYISTSGLTGSGCYINARVVDISSPSGLARALLRYALPKLAKQLLPYAEGLHRVADALSREVSELQESLRLVDGSEFWVSDKACAPFMKVLTEDPGDIRPLSDLAKVLELYTAVLDAWYQAKAAGKLQEARPPVLALDDANALMTWGEQDKANRQTLLRFFLAITKERNSSHVLLATSEYAFQSWLCKGEAAD